MTFFAIFGAVCALLTEKNGKPLARKWVIIIAIVCACLGGLWKYKQNNSYYENSGCIGLGIARWC